jgi:hypothetical protein
MAKRYIWTSAGFSPIRQQTVPTARQRADNTDAYNYIPEDSGLAHTTVMEPELSFNKAPNETVIKNTRVGDGRANIVFGTDRPSDLLSGYGAKGAQFSSCIDIVVGRMAGFIASDRGPEDGNIVNNSFNADAARIYISQMTNVDQDFGLARNENGYAFGSKIGDKKGRSAIAVKADGVRIIGRQGVKIVTGPMRNTPGGEVSSKGDRLAVAPTIELIAGNYDGELSFAVPGMPGFIANLPITKKVPALQGVARGQNTQDAIADLTAMVEDIIGALTNFVLMYAQDRGILGLPLPPMAFGGPTPATVTTPLMCSTVMTRVDASLHQTRANMQVFKLHYIEPVGYKRIASTNVFST